MSWDLGLGPILELSSLEEAWAMLLQLVADQNAAHQLRRPAVPGDMVKDGELVAPQDLRPSVLHNDELSRGLGLFGAWGAYATGMHGAASAAVSLLEAEHAARKAKLLLGEGSLPERRIRADAEENQVKLVRLIGHGKATAKLTEAWAKKFQKLYDAFSREISLRVEESRRMGGPR